MPNQSYNQKLGRVKFKTEIDPGEVQFRQENENKKKEVTKK